MRKLRWLIVCLGALLLVTACKEIPAENKGESLQALLDGNQKIEQLYQAHTSDVWVTGVGEVTRILPDDNEGLKHQKFILRLSNQDLTIQIAHDISIGQRVDGLKVGDEIKFVGEYYYNKQGGGVHWTHHDNSGKTKGGYLIKDGKMYK
ncbi:MAG: DUF3465 domain-containing protein [Streptococcaceae bacterium]|jgi:hypothetical protein|nr:DUF3465 domain-containing protein [Streptococcaceae bacterium]